MSSKQAAGKPVDKRADIWSFGVVLSEMLVGEQLFKGETVSHILVSVLKDDPDLSRVPLKHVGSCGAARKKIHGCVYATSARRDYCSTIHLRSPFP
jgi:serine/threonine protein kinase